jgi:hypothetical protein
MTFSSIQILVCAAKLGLKLGVENGDTLTVQPFACCSPKFVETLRDYKPQLLALLRLPFVMVHSEVLGETVFLAENDSVRAALIEARAGPWSIYTRDELRILVAHNRAKPFLPRSLAFHGDRPRKQEKAEDFRSHEIGWCQNGAATSAPGGAPQL